MMDNDTRDRLIALERDVKYLSREVSEMNGKVDEMHSLIMQAKGFRWAIITVAGIGGFVAGFAAKLFPLWR